MVVTSPYLYYVLDGLGEADSEGWRRLTNAFAGDALNPIVPTEVTGLGHWWFEDMSSKFSNFTPSEAGGYVGVVLIGIVLAFAVSRWRRPATRVLVGVIVVCFVVSLGTELHVAGENTGIWMPWSLLHPLPLFDHVITSRFWVFALLAIAIAVALWLAEPSRRRAAKWAVAVAGLALLVPNVSSDFWSGRPTERAFFTGDEHERYVREDERVLVLPFTPSSMLWQAETGMAFEMVEGYLSPEPPADYRNDPFYDELVSSEIGGEEGLEELRDFLERREVTAVVVEQKAAGPWPLMLAGLGLTPIKTGGVIFYRVRSGLAA
jgi:hypothetical protein